MTSGPTPTQASKNEAPRNEAPRNEAEYARKLALAILSTLESKGLLSKMDVDTILHVAHRTAMQAQAKADSEGTEENQGAENQEVENQGAAEQATLSDDIQAGATQTEKPGPPEKSVLTAPVEVKRALGPAVLGTRWVKPDPTLEPEATVAPPAHEADAVKVVGPAAAQDRPLGPPILTGKTQTVQAVAAPGEPVAKEPISKEPVSKEPVSKEEAERQVRALESRVQQQASASTSASARPAKTAPDVQEDALVIDLNLD